MYTVHVHRPCNREMLAMTDFNKYRLMSRLIAAGAFWLLCSTCEAGGPMGIMPVDHRPRFMLYISHSFGGAGGSSGAQSLG